MNLPSAAYLGGWLFLLVAGVALEVLALLDPDSGDTLSSYINRILGAHEALYALGLASLVWAGVHFFGQR